MFHMFISCYVINVVSMVPVLREFLRCGYQPECYFMLELVYQLLCCRCKNMHTVLCCRRLVNLKYIMFIDFIKLKINTLVRVLF
jgi:hypothetical protein